MSHINDAHWEELKDLFGDDLADLVKTFITDSQGRIDRLKQAQKEGNNELGIDESHTLKGASDNLGAEQLSKHCFTMQQVCHAKMIDAAHNVIADIEEEFAHVSQEVMHRLA